MWHETTLRKGTKSPKICRDMFISDYGGDFRLAVVRNGRLKTKERLSRSEAKKLIEDNSLIATRTIFSRLLTYRDPKSTMLIRNLADK